MDKTSGQTVDAYSRPRLHQIYPSDAVILQDFGFAKLSVCVK